MTELEDKLYEYIRKNPGVSAIEIGMDFGSSEDVKQAIISLLAEKQIENKGKSISSYYIKYVRH